MLFSSNTAHRCSPLLAGVVVGLTLTWGSVHAAALLPTLTLAGLASGQTVSGAVSLSARASAAGFSSLQFQVSGQNIGSAITTGACAVSWDTTTVTNGSHTATAVASDSVGNLVWAAPIMVTVNNVATGDTVSPSVTISAPLAGATVSGIASLAASASDNVSVAGVWFTVDGTTVGAEDGAAPYQASWSTASASSGSHTLRAVARDAAGNIGTSAPVTVTVSTASADLTAPTASVSAPVAGATVSGSVTVSANASDNIGVASVQFLLDNVALGSADTTVPFSVAWNSASSTNGAHALRAVARDAAGNTTTSAAVTVTASNGTADTTPPAISMTAPAAGTTLSGTVTLTATATDNVGVVSVRFTVDGSTIGVADTAAPWAASWTTTNVSNGSHVLQAIAQDAAGNTQRSSSVTVTVNNGTRPRRRNR